MFLPFSVVGSAGRIGSAEEPAQKCSFYIYMYTTSWANARVKLHSQVHIAFLTCPDLTCPDLTLLDLTLPDLTLPDLTFPELTCHKFLT